MPWTGFGGKGVLINKYFSVYNLHGDSLVQLRSVKDHINRVGSILNVKISKELLANCSSGM